MFDRDMMIGFGVWAVIVLGCVCFGEGYGGGVGDANSPFQIWTAEQMNTIGLHEEDWGKCFVLMADIDMSEYTGVEYNIIGKRYTNNQTWIVEDFRGIFDGAGHVISNLTFTDAEKDYVGMFGYVGEGGRICNVRLENASIAGDFRVGGLVGWNSGVISGCSVVGEVVGGERTGGLVGISEGGSVFNCYVNASVSGRYAVGVLIGENTGMVVNSYAGGSVIGEQTVGGLVGINSSKSIITNSFSTVSVSWCSSCGGLVGSGSGRVFQSFWDMEKSGRITSDGGVGKTTEEMYNIGTYAGWGYMDAWKIEDGVGYPHLAWEGTSGELIRNASRGYTGGGTADEPYLIYDAEDLCEIGLHLEDSNSYFSLMNDIDMSDYEENYVMIGLGAEFTGCFEGNGHVITDFNYTEWYESYAGFFGRVGKEGVIRNLSLENVDITGRYRVGGIAASNYGNILNCQVTGSVLNYSSSSGGMAGYNGGRISDCRICCDTIGTNEIGGVAGYNTGEGVISNCAVRGNVTALNDFAGGIVGWNGGEIVRSFSEAGVSGDDKVGGAVGNSAEGSSLVDSYARGDVTGGEGYAGGLVGGSYYCLVSRCYSTGKVTGEGLVGGLIGDNTGPVFQSFWDMENSGLSESRGGVGLGTEEMKDMDSFAGWENEGIWVIEEGIDYPHLEWEGTSGQLIVNSPKPYSGRGSVEEPYLIYTAEEMSKIGLYLEDSNSHFILMNDIDMTGYDKNNFFSPGLGREFNGTFDGNGHAIQNFSYHGGSNNCVGLFGIIGKNGKIRDLELENVDVEGYTDAGCLVGRNFGEVADVSIWGNFYAGYQRYSGGLAGRNTGTIRGSFFEGAIIFNSIDYAGGLVGENCAGGVISNCHMRGTIDADSGYQIGGLIGSNQGFADGCYVSGYRIEGDWVSNVGGLAGVSGGSIVNCYVEDAIIAVRYCNRLGGLVGYSYTSSKTKNCFVDCEIGIGDNAGGLVGINSGEIADCFAKGKIRGEDYTGGLIGTNYYGSVYRCFSTVKIVVHGYRTGGLVGLNDDGAISSSFWDVTSSGMAVGYNVDSADPGMVVDVFGLSTGIMKKVVTFLDAGWDFLGESENGDVDVWRMCGDGVDYPRLVWEFDKGGDLVCPDGVDVYDLEVVCGQWLMEGDDYCGDIGPVFGGDGIVNLFDFAVLADRWLIEE